MGLICFLNKFGKEKGVINWIKFILCRKEVIVGKYLKKRDFFKIVLEG